MRDLQNRSRSCRSRLSALGCDHVPNRGRLLGRNIYGSSGIGRAIRNFISNPQISRCLRLGKSGDAAGNSNGRRTGLVIIRILAN